MNALGRIGFRWTATPHNAQQGISPTGQPLPPALYESWHALGSRCNRFLKHLSAGRGQRTTTKRKQ